MLRPGHVPRRGQATFEPRVSDAPKAQAPPWESGRLPPTKNPEGVRQSASRLLVQPLQGCPWNRGPLRPRVASRAADALLTLGSRLYCPFGPKEQRSAVSKQPSLRTWNAAPWIVTSEHLRMLRGCLAASRDGTGFQPSLPFGCERSQDSATLRPGLFSHRPCGTGRTSGPARRKKPSSHEKTTNLTQAARRPVPAFMSGKDTLGVRARG